MENALHMLVISVPFIRKWLVGEIWLKKMQKLVPFMKGGLLFAYQEKKSLKYHKIIKTFHLYI